MKQVFDPKLISTEKDNIHSENILSIDDSNAQLNLQIILDKLKGSLVELGDSL